MTVNSPNLKLEIGGQEIERIGENCQTKYFKFVGMLVDECNTWKYHKKYIANKLASANFILARSKNHLPPYLRKKLYNTLFRPYMQASI